MDTIAVMGPSNIPYISKCSSSFSNVFFIAVNHPMGVVVNHTVLARYIHAYIYALQIYVYPLLILAIYIHIYLYIHTILAT